MGPKEAARTAIERDGAYFPGPNGGPPKPHPALAVERDSRIAFARLVRELALDDVSGPEAPRPPRTGGGHAR